MRTRTLRLHPRLFEAQHFWHHFPQLQQHVGVFRNLFQLPFAAQNPSGDNRVFGHELV